MMKTQTQMYYDAQKNDAALNEAFMELVRNKDITKGELASLILKRPAVYGKFAKWLDILPDKN